ncbi:Flp pilus assembly protein CpaB [Ferrimonas balearica]|uniref:Flp pilus assembly protein CpaB n=1 Tax=Ferrimonas balearica TaxID=44012 RepID=UPI001C9A028C|nr:Flp pilus assembly protein CpaB [Ferrimonas balearica]MBY5992038.1 Flp pilus assembly protein CpaB [Ferrimonas balearica]
MRSMVFVLISIAFGVGAVLMAQRWLDQSQAQVPTADTVPVIAMAVSVPSGTILQEKHLVQRSVPRELAPAKSYSDLQEVSGMVSKFPLVEGDIVSPQKLAPKGEGSVLASLISPNMRAVTIRVNDVVGVAGFLLPGNRVDVLVTLKQRPDAGVDWAANTEVILSNLKVLAVDQKANQDSNQPLVVRAVTLEVTLEQAETLMSARNKGNIQLALRNPNDSADVQVASLEPMQPKDTLPVVEPEAAPVKVPAPRQRKRMEVIKGTHQQSVTIGRDQSPTLAQKDG